MDDALTKFPKISMSGFSTPSYNPVNSPRTLFTVSRLVSPCALAIEP